MCPRRPTTTSCTFAHCIVPCSYDPFLSGLHLFQSSPARDSLYPQIRERLDLSLFWDSVVVFSFIFSFRGMGVGGMEEGRKKERKGKKILVQCIWVRPRSELVPGCFVQIELFCFRFFSLQRQLFIKMTRSQQDGMVPYCTESFLELIFNIRF